MKPPASLDAMLIDAEAYTQINANVLGFSLFTSHSSLIRVHLCLSAVKKIM